ncbi:MAG: hypothetical protein M4579_006745 [Chaenotheca gracillima]|nr:MAG: hypothetical protein M4579_006745 [Chaenotheca gracillima]
MPVLHDPNEPPLQARPKAAPPPEVPPPLMQRCDSEESIPTELCDGPLLETDATPAGDGLTSPPLALFGAGSAQRVEVSDRVELMERIKRGESPTWVPNRTLENQIRNKDPASFKRSLEVLDTKKSPLLPAAELQPSRKPDYKDDGDVLSRPEDIQRPRSALHSGDFTQEQSPPQHRYPDPFHVPGTVGPPSTAGLSSSPPAPWAFQSSYQFPSPFTNGPYNPFQAPEDPPWRSRAPSLSSYSSSFVFKAPTSPLVQASSNQDADYSPTSSPLQISDPASRNPRRNTLPRQQLSSSQSSPPGQLPVVQGGGRPAPSMRREVTLPYQAHQPRRSISSAYSLHPSSYSPQTPPAFRSRRPSLSSEMSPLQHASMVGSYEESILRGRMSTTPSKPLNFMAQIGVLGKGNCRANLKCPAHVSVPFPAVFYSYGNANAGRASAAEDHPSPYVGLIDLENSLAKPDGPKEDRVRKPPPPRPSSDLRITGLEDTEMDLQQGPKLSERELRKREHKKKRRSLSPKTPPGGSYRIPEKGQLQIVIKNPNKTAVKLFLVPYDLEGMEAGSKTFVRQRSYSAGPIIDLPTSSKGESPMNERDSKERPTLRYLIHLHICSPSRGRFYLYKSIRVVFANRVPDGKENLRNEIQLPEPRYSAYKPNRDSFNPGPNASSVNVTPAAERNAYRRRSSVFPLQSSARYDALDGIGESESATPFALLQQGRQPFQPAPFSFSPPPRVPASRADQMDVDERPSTDDSNGTTSNPSNAPTAMHDSFMSSSSSSSGTYGKLRRGDAGYGGNPFVPNGEVVEIGEGLLARRLKGLEVQRELERRDHLSR